MITNKQIQAKIAEAINHSGKTQIELAQMLGLRQPIISHYARGERMPSVEALANLCKVLELDANDILCLYK